MRMRFGDRLQSQVQRVSHLSPTLLPSPAGRRRIVRRFVEQASVVVIVVLFFAADLLAGETKQVSATEVAKQLDSLKGEIATEATARLRTNPIKGSYTTVW
jgi:hypothetical protein